MNVIDLLGSRAREMLSNKVGTVIAVTHNIDGSIVIRIETDAHVKEWFGMNRLEFEPESSRVMPPPEFHQRPRIKTEA
jgi:hypothetical protein